MSLPDILKDRLFNCDLLVSVSYEWNVLVINVLTIKSNFHFTRLRHLRKLRLLWITMMSNGILLISPLEYNNSDMIKSSAKHPLFEPILIVRLRLLFNWLFRCYQVTCLSKMDILIWKFIQSIESVHILYVKWCANL